MRIFYQCFAAMLLKNIFSFLRFVGNDSLLLGDTFRRPTHIQ